MPTREEILNLQADRIEQTLEGYGVYCQVFGGQVLPQMITFAVQLARGTRLREIEALKPDIARALQVPAIRLKQRDGAVVIEVPSPEVQTVTFRQMIARIGATSPQPHTMLLGLAEDGIPLLLYLPSPDVAHVLIAGMTGSGKTELLRTMIVSLATWTKRHQALCFLVDPKRRKLTNLGGLPMVEACYTSPESMPLILDRLLAEMEKRDKLGYSNPHIYLVIDELADIVMVGGRPVEIGLTRLVQRGREAGFSVIATTQRPSAQVIAGLMKANFPIRITGLVVSASDASIATGLPGTGGERLGGQGDMLCCQGSKVLRFKAAMVEPADITAISAGRGAIVDQVDSSKDLKRRLQQRLRLVPAGRPAVPPDEEMIAFALERLCKTGECSQRELRRWHEEQFGQDVNARRAAAAIEEAQQRLVQQGLKLG